VVATGVATDLLLRSRIDGVAATAVAIATAGTLLASRRLRGDPAALTTLGAACVTAMFLCLRSSEWLVPLNVVAVGGLIFLATCLPRIDSWRDVPVGSLVLRSVEVATAAFAGPGVLRREVAGAVPTPSAAVRRRAAPLVRGLALALPVVALLCALLASADAVFASFFNTTTDPSPLFGHLALSVVGVWLASVILWFATGRWEARHVQPPIRLGATEALVVLGGLVAVYGLFVVSQLIAAGASESTIVSTTGLTRADYARSGFFQLLWAAGITFVVLLVIHWSTGRDRTAPRLMRTLQVASVFLTLPVVAVAIRRLDLYSDAYGLTMLRLYCTVFAWWLGAAMIVTALYVVRSWRHRWLATAIAGLAFATLLAVNVADPERVVVEHNVQRTVDGHPLDVGYLASLSDDAVPALAASVDVLPDDEAERVTRALCRRSVPSEAWYGFNMSSSRAGDALAAMCSGSD
jgi:hypothetical protein